MTSPLQLTIFAISETLIMEKLSIKLEHCYGIKKLEYNFDFTNKPTYVIYAPNGVMKTSLAKTFKDLSNNQESGDSIFKERPCLRNIIDENHNPINADNVFVISPYEETYHSKKMSTLLVKNDLKTRYDEIHTEIDEKKNSFLNSLKVISGISKIEEIEIKISTDFTHNPKRFFTAIQRVESEVSDTPDEKFEGVKYGTIFNDKVLKALSNADFRTQLILYIEKYNALLDRSTFFKKGVFNHYNASTIAKNLKDNGFFRAEHSITLNTGEGAKKVVVATEQQLTEIIQKEKDSILYDQELLSSFNNIDKQLSANQDLRDLRDFLGQNPTFLTELDNLDLLRQNLWIYYFQNHEDVYNELLTLYKQGKTELEGIIEQAKSERTQWAEVIEVFNSRFSVPFLLSIDNQDDVILKSETPSIKFTFKDRDNSSVVDEQALKGVLSNGELRALYLLNIIFEVEARKHNHIETLYIVDDIADSFDYKNKYAIIEYLKDISKEPFFKLLILTHNYDFYRTVGSRLDVARDQKLHAEKGVNDIRLRPEKYQNNPFVTWKSDFDKIGKEAMLIASIPFVRNLAEYSGDEENFLKLTSVLHVKDGTATLKVSDIQDIFRKVLKDKATLTIPNGQKRIIDLIYETATALLAIDEDRMELESKIVLAIAIRLKAEEFIIAQINDTAFLQTITSNQTFKLVRKYKGTFPAESSNIKILDQVSLMTPENIHVNSFMYEPILDMSNHHLKELFTKVSALH